MKRTTLLIAVTFALFALSFAPHITAKSKASPKEPVGMSEAEATRLGTEAYIYGYPLVMMDMTRRVMTNVATPQAEKAPMGTFAHMRAFPSSTSKDVTSPNDDTLYSSAWIDVSNEPYMLEMPDQGDRYYSIPMFTAWTEIFASPGKRLPIEPGKQYIIVGPGWKGVMPNSFTVLRSPTNMIWILGRTYSTGTQEDYQAVHELQNDYRLAPLSSYGRTYTPPPNPVDPTIDMKTPVRDQVNALDANAFFKKLAQLLVTNPPTQNDAPVIAMLSKLGIVPGQDFDMSKVDPNIANGLTKAVKNAQDMIMAPNRNFLVKNGWSFSNQAGSYGTNYLQRAHVAAFGLGSNLPEDAIYATTNMDDNGQKLNGENQYVIHFEKGQLPPVKAFWSLTMYNDQNFFVDNPQKKYAINSREHLVQNNDGSTDLYIQYVSPDKDKEANWLPAPMGDFVLTFRFYWPDSTLIDGTWTPPEVKKVTVLKDEMEDFNKRYNKRMTRRYWHQSYYDEY